MSLLREWWGPRFWKILHTLAECSGNMNSPILANDEADYWTILLKTQGSIMPCALCRTDYNKWLLNHKIGDLRVLKEERKNYLRTWLFNCHNGVNSRTSKPLLEMDELLVLYKKEHIGKVVTEIYEMIRIALERSQLQYEDVNRWKNALTRLRMLYGI
jgi:hypothetical protein